MSPELPGEPVLPKPVLLEPLLPEQSAEDTDIAWGDVDYRDSGNDRLQRDRPPHWSDY